MALVSNTQLVAPSTGGRNLQLTPNATPDNAIVSGTSYISSLILDNSLNAAASFLKLYDAASPTIGTSAPDFIFKVAASEKLQVTFHKNKPKFTTALSLACVTAGGTAGTVSPSSSVPLGLVVQTSDDST